MATLTFTKAPNGLYRCALPSTVGTVQISLSRPGVCAVYASLDASAGYSCVGSVDVPQAQSAAIFKVNLPQCSSVYLETDYSVTSAIWVE